MLLILQENQCMCRYGLLDDDDKNDGDINNNKINIIITKQASKREIRNRTISKQEKEKHVACSQYTIVLFLTNSFQDKVNVFYYLIEFIIIFIIL